MQALSNRAPVAAADAITSGEDEPTLLDVLGNDRDPNAGDAITITDVMTTGLRGQATLAPDGKLYYSVNGAFEELGVGQTATESFSYTIRDRAGLTSTAAVTVTIQGRMTRRSRLPTLRRPRRRAAPSSTRSPTTSTRTPAMS